MSFRISLILATMGFLVTEALACSCAPPGPNRCELPTAPVAFVGTVMSKQVVDLRPPVEPIAGNRGRRSVGDPWPPRDDSYVAVTFQITDPLRGKLEDTIVVGTDAVNSSCSYPFEIGRAYLVFASPNANDGTLRTSICHGTRLADSETALIQQLREARAGGKMADLFGLITHPRVSSGSATFEKPDPASTLTVTAKSGAGEYRAQTGVDGSYEFRGLPPGLYSITVQLPPARLTSQPPTLNVGAGVPCRADFQFKVP